jgi:nitroreductase
MFRDTSMDYLSRDEVLEIWNHNMRLTDEQLLAMDETEFRARVRERSHHTLEIQLYATAYRHQKLKPNQADYTKHLLELWEKRGLGKDLPEYRYASFLIDAAEKLVKGEDVDLTPYKPTPVTEQMEKDFFTIVKERRSVREFKDKEVPDELIDKILEAGLWAAHGCNVQSIRYVVVREKNEPGLFRGSDVPGGPVHLVILQDMRCYRANSFTPVRNQLLDAGAAGQQDNIHSVSFQRSARIIKIGIAGQVDNVRFFLGVIQGQLHLFQNPRQWLAEGAFQPLLANQRSQFIADKRQ